MEVVAVDIDEVMFPFVDEFAKHHNELYGTQIGKADFKSYRFEEALKGTFEEAMDRVYAFCDLDHREIPPLVDSAGLKKLAENYNLIAVTARNPRFGQQTKQWLGHHFPDIFGDIVMIGYAPAMEQPVTKAEVCEQLGAIALIDDSVSHVTECAEIGIKGILFGEYPWNTAENLPPNVFRCTTWNQVEECLDAR